jgi:hypothetical protein
MRKAQKVTIDADAFEDFVDEYFRKRVVSIEVLNTTDWRHPWQTDLTWDYEGERWTAAVWPGFCVSGTGIDPQVIVPGSLVGLETRTRLGLELRRPTEDPIEAYLSESPRIALPPIKWRSIGTDAVVVSGSAGEPVPERFRRRGVMSPTELDTQGDNGAVVRVSGLVEDRRQARLLRACDLVLTHDRVRSVVQPTVVEGSVDVEFSQIGTMSRKGPWVEVQRQFEPPGAGIVDLVIGAAADTGRDSLHLATLYLLSPEGEEPGAVPDETWEPSAIYRHQWNLGYRATYEDRIVEPTRITIAVPQLGGGALGIRAQPIVDELNRRTAELEAALRKVENVGVFSRA